MSNTDTAATPPPPDPTQDQAQQPQDQGGADWFAQAQQRTSSDFEGRVQETADQANQDQGAFRRYVVNPIGAAGGGIVEGMFSTKDFFTGGAPAQEDKSNFRQRLEQTTDVLTHQNVGNAVAEGIGQVAAGLYGAGKFVKAGKAVVGLREGGAIAKAVTGAATGVIAGTVAFDPHQERMSNLIQSFPALQNPVTAALAAKPGDTEWEGRLKSAMENMGLEVVAGALGATVRGVKYSLSGDTQAAAAAGAEANDLLAKRVATEAARKQPEVLLGGQAPPEHLKGPGPTEAPIGPTPEESALGAAEQASAKAANDQQYLGVVADVLRDRRVTHSAIQQATGLPLKGVRDIMQRLEDDGVVSKAPAKGRRTVLLGEEADTNTLPSLAGGTDASSAKADAAVTPKASPTAPLETAPGSPPRQPDMTDFVNAREDRRAARFTQGLQDRGIAAPVTTIGADAERPPVEQVVQALPRAQGPAGGNVVALSRQTTPARPFGIADLPADAIPTIVKQARADAAAVEQHGGFIEAAAAGHQFGNVPIPFNKVGTPAEASLLLQRVADHLQPVLDQARGGVNGVLKDASVNRTAMRFASLFNDAPDQFVSSIQAAGTAARSMVQQMEAGYLVATKAFDEATKLGIQADAGVIDKVAAVDQIRNRLMIGHQVYADTRAIVAAAGRAVRRHRTDFIIKPDQLAALGNMDDDSLLAAIRAAEGDPIRLAQAADPSTWSRWATRKLSFLMVNNPLWWYPTHVRNLLGTVQLIYQRPLEKVIGGAVQAAIGNTAGGANLAQGLRELRVTHAQFSDGFASAVDTFKQGQSATFPHGIEHLEAAPLFLQKFDGSVNSLTRNAIGSVAYAIGLPTRALGAADDMLKTVRARAVIVARATGEAEALRLPVDQANGYVQKALRDAFDPSGQLIDVAAAREAKIATLNQDLLEGTIGAQIQNAVSNVPLLRAIFTYVKTPTNNLRYTVKMTPGLNLLQQEYRQMLRGDLGSEQQAHAIGQMALGSLAAGSALMTALGGHLTGVGPSDPAARKVLSGQGWKPSAFMWRNGDGTLNYLPLASFGPAETAFSIAGDLADIYAHPQASEDDKISAITAYGLAMAHALSDQSFLYSVKSAVDAMSDPDKNLAKYAGREVGGLLPFASLFRNLNPDPYMHDTRGFVETIKQGLPGFSPTLPKSYDELGQPLLVHNGLWSTESTDPVAQELRRLRTESGGKGLSPMSPKKTYMGFNTPDMRDITLEDGRTAYDRVQEASAKPPGITPLRTALAKMMGTPGYRKAAEGSNEKGSKLALVSAMVDRYRTAGYQAVLAQSPLFRKAVSLRALNARAAQLANRSGQPATAIPQAISSITQAFGFTPPGQ